MSGRGGSDGLLEEAVESTVGTHRCRGRATTGALGPGEVVVPAAAGAAVRLGLGALAHPAVGVEGVHDVDLSVRVNELLLLGLELLLGYLLRRVLLRGRRVLRLLLVGLWRRLLLRLRLLLWVQLTLPPPSIAHFPLPSFQDAPMCAEAINGTSPSTGWPSNCTPSMTLITVASSECW